MHPHRRQVTSDPLAPPTGVAGITDGAVTVGTDSATKSAFVFDSTVTSNSNATPVTAPALAPGTSVVVTPTPPPSPTSSATAVPSPAAAVKAPIPLSTVIGVCVAAFVGASTLIFIGWWIYKRSARHQNIRSRKSRAPLSDNRNARSELDLTKSRQEPWVKLEEGDTKWEDNYQTKEVDALGPMEKLTMFKKALSIRSTVTGKYSSDNLLPFENQPFSQYHPDMAQELAEAPKRHFLGRVDTGPPISWDGETVVSHGSLLSLKSLKSPRLPTSPMSTGRNVAIPTPQAVSSEPHRWETAQVMDFDQELAESESGHGNKPSLHLREQRAGSSGKGKQRVQDPFADQTTATQALPKFHFTTPSSSSTYNNERALQSLIAVLDVTPEEVEERLRAASIPPSTISASSYVEDATFKFPRPPL